jgi:hypothetical protein
MKYKKEYRKFESLKLKKLLQSTIDAVIIRGQLLKQLMVCLATGLNQGSSLLFSTFFKNKSYFILLFQIFLNLIFQSQSSKFTQ